jgi:hypothetical protein
MVSPLASCLFPVCTKDAVLKLMLDEVGFEFLKKQSL